MVFMAQSGRKMQDGDGQNHLGSFRLSDCAALARLKLLLELSQTISPRGPAWPRADPRRAAFSGRFSDDRGME